MGKRNRVSVPWVTGDVRDLVREHALTRREAIEQKEEALAAKVRVTGGGRGGLCGFVGAPPG